MIFDLKNSTITGRIGACADRSGDAAGVKKANMRKEVLTVKKMIKRGICVLLCLVMVCSIPLCASAANSNYKQFTSLFSIGDSNTMGYGLKGYKDYENRDYLHGLKGTFTAYVRDYVGAENKCNTMAYPGLRTKDVLYYLGGDVDMTGDKYFEKYSRDSWAQGLVKDNGKNKNNFINIGC